MKNTETNHELNRRSAILLGVGSVAALFGAGSFAIADDAAGQELSPGVTLKILKEVDPMGPVPGLKKARLMEITWQPGASFRDPNPSKSIDICEIQGAPLYVEFDGKDPFTLQPGDIYFCPVGTLETDTNKSDKPSIMRIVEIDPA